MKATFTFLLLALALGAAAQENPVADSSQAAMPAPQQVKPFYQTGSHFKITTRKEISRMPSRDEMDAVSLSPEVYQARRGQDISIGGARPGGNLYVIDGVQVQRR